MSRLRSCCSAALGGSRTLLHCREPFFVGVQLYRRDSYFCGPDPHKGQSISKTRPSRFVILSAAKDLCPARDPSLRSELALERSEGMTLLHRLRVDSQHVFFEMYWAQDHTAVQDRITNCYAGLQSNAAKSIADACLSVEPGEWWQGLKMVSGEHK